MTDINELRQSLGSLSPEDVVYKLIDHIELAEKGCDELRAAVCREGDRADAYHVEVFVLRAKIEAAEKERDTLRAELLDAKETVRELFYGAGVANMTITALQAKIEAAEKAVVEAYQHGYATGQEEIEKALEISEKSLHDLTEKVIPNLQDQLEAAERERDTYKVAHEEWIEKTEWVQRGINDGTIPLKYLGWHRADIVADLLSVAEKEAAPSIRPAALYPVINWLRNGCDPMKAAYELEMIAAAPKTKL